MLLSHLCKKRQSSTDEVWPAASHTVRVAWWQSWEWTHSPIAALCCIPHTICTGTHHLLASTSLKTGTSYCFSITWPLPGVWDTFMSACKPATEGHAHTTTLWWGIVVRVRVTLAAVLHQEAGVVPGHAEDPIWLMKEHVGQHSAMAVHDDNLSISSAKQNLKITEQPSVPPNLSHCILLQTHLVTNLATLEINWKQSSQGCETVPQ